MNSPINTSPTIDINELKLIDICSPALRCAVNSKFKITIPDNESTVRNYKLIDSKGNIHIMCQSNFKALQANLVRNHIIKSQDSN